MLIRTETKNDYKHVFNLNYEAFGKRDDESRLVERIRFSNGFIRELSLVGEEKGEIVGHILLSKAKIIDKNGETEEVLVLAPVAVKPELQRKGIGGRLINKVLERATDSGYGLVFLIGHPSYYPKFGFQPARAHGVELTQFEITDDVFMVYELKVGELKKVQGELYYPSSFFG